MNSAAFQIVLILAVASVVVYEFVPQLLTKMIIICTLWVLVAVSAIGVVPGIEAYSMFGLATPKMLLIPPAGSLAIFVILKIIHIYNRRMAAR